MIPIIWYFLNIFWSRTLLFGYTMLLFCKGCKEVDRIPWTILAVLGVGVEKGGAHLITPITNPRSALPNHTFYIY